MHAAGFSGSPVEATGLGKVYGGGDGATVALRGVDVAFSPGTFTALMGPSGSGKSTLLYCLAGLERPTSGRALLLGQDIAAHTRTQAAVFRRDHVGFVFQSYNLLPSLSVFENVVLPLRLARRPVDDDAIAGILESVGLEAKRDARPSQLSGGQQQRVAIARVLATRPQIVFADEPTGALDVATGSEVLALLRGLAAGGDQAVVMATHDPSAAAGCDRVVFLRDGEVDSEMTRPSVDEVAAHLAHLRDRTAR